jgi:hypothetical protein
MPAHATAPSRTDEIKNTMNIEIDGSPRRVNFVIHSANAPVAIVNKTPGIQCRDAADWINTLMIATRKQTPLSTLKLSLEYGSDRNVFTIFGIASTICIVEPQIRSSSATPPNEDL